MIELEHIRDLDVAAEEGASATAYVSAASGLVRLGDFLHVIADDELSLATFRIDDPSPGRLTRVLSGELPPAPADRKRAKPDFEALVALPPVSGCDRGALLALGSGLAYAESLTLYCAADEAWCQQIKTTFEEKTGITVDMTRKSSGETYAQLRAEAGNPKGDVWWGGTGDPHLQAAEEDLTEAYESPMRGELHDWAIKQAEAAGNKTIGVYSGALGFGYNKDLLAKNGLPEPKCWADLTKPEYKGQIQMANPNSSGTAYTMLATMVQLMGEDKGFEFLKALHANINQYTKSGSAPIKAAGLGETTIGIVFMHDAVAQTAAGFPIVTVSPCEGTGYEIGSMSLIKGARNPEAAKKFYDWALSAEMQSRAKDVKSFQLPSNKAAEVSELTPDLSTIKLIDYDFKKYGSSDERKRLLQKWDTEVSSLPQ